MTSNIAGYFRLLLTRLFLILSITFLGTSLASAQLAINDNNTHVDRGVTYLNSPFLTATGGTGPYTFSSVSGLPVGITVNPDGTLSGQTCGSNGSYVLSATVTDSLLVSSVDAPRLIVNNSPGAVCDAAVITIAPVSLPSGQVASAYSQLISASGGTAPYNFTVTAGALPAGLTLAANGTLAGTPTAAGSFNFSVTALDVNNATATRAYTLIIAAPTITVSPVSLPAGQITLPYSQAISASGGTGPYTFAVTAGALPAGLTLTTNGTLSGAPTVSGTFNFTVTATDSLAFTGARAYTLLINAAPTITVSPVSLPAGQITQPYSQLISASGGTGPYTFAVTAGTLPAGLTLATNGTLSGTPTVSGSFDITVTATDTLNFTGSRAYTLLINAAPTITVSPVSLPAGQITLPYSQAISASGGTGPYTFAVTAGALPAGLTLASNGTLSGTPTVSGSFNITVTATDTLNFTGSRAYTLLINAAPTIVVSPSTLPAGQITLPYSQAISASGGTGPYTFAVTAGALPAGLTLATNGTLSGTPTVSGSFNVTVTATDTLNFTGSQAYTLLINAAPTITVSPVSLPAGQITLPYSQAISASGGTGPYTFAVTAGTLPAGLTLATNGTLSGTPTVSGSFNVTVTATDTNNFTGSRAYTLLINAAPVITVTPSALPAGQVGSAYSQPVSASGGTGPYTFAVTNGALPAGLTLATNGTLSGTPTVAGSFNFTVTATDTNNFTGSQAISLSINTATRPDPTLDPDIIGIVNAKVAVVTRFASAQMDNVHGRLEDAVGCTEAFVNKITLTAPVQGAQPNAVKKAEERDCSDKPHAWLAGNISSGKQNLNNGVGNTGLSTNGLTVGADVKATPDLLVGAAVGFASDRSDIGNAASSPTLSSSGASLFVYGSWRLDDKFYLNGVLGYGRASFDYTRRIALDSTEAVGANDAIYQFASIGLTKKAEVNGFVLTPYLRGERQSTRMDAYTETGPSILTLSFDEARMSSTAYVLGITASKPMMTSFGRVEPTFRLEFRNTHFSGFTQGMNYADQPGGPLYGLRVNGSVNNAAILGIGARYTFSRDVSGMLEYRYAIGSGDTYMHSLRALISIGF